MRTSDILSLSCSYC